MLVSRARRFLPWLCALAVAGPALAQTEGFENDPPLASEPMAPTGIESPRDVERLRQLEGITLQWISWERRGRVTAGPDDDGVWQLTGTQYDQTGAGVQVSGVITEIGEDYFVLQGRVVIGDTPDIGRSCDRTSSWRFVVTQNRSYYRLREFEWCDYLTDYIDIYFNPALR